MVPARSFPAAIRAARRTIRQCDAAPVTGDDRIRALDALADLGGLLEAAVVKCGSWPLSSADARSCRQINRLAPKVGRLVSRLHRSCRV